MSISLYEQFMAVGSVKSLLTGKEVSVSRTEDAKTKNTPPPSQTSASEK